MYKKKMIIFLHIIMSFYKGIFYSPDTISGINKTAFKNPIQTFINMINKMIILWPIYPCLLLS